MTTTGLLNILTNLLAHGLIKLNSEREIEFMAYYDHLTKLSWGMPVDYRFIEYFTNEAKVKDVKRLIKK